jgi:hypothetical protein
LHGEDHPSYVTVLNNLAVLQEERGHFDAACEMYSRALQPVMKHYGMNHPHVAAILNNIAVVKRKQGKLEEADPCQHQALTIGMAALKVGHPSLLIWRHNLDVLYELKATRDEKKLAEERMRLAQKQQEDDERLRLDEEKWIREEEQQREWQQRTKKRKRQNSGPPLPKSKGPNSKSHNSKSHKRAKPSVVDKERRKKETRKVNKWSPSDDARKTGTWQDYEHAAFVRAIESRIGGPVVSLAKQLWNKEACTSKFFDGGTIDDAWNVIARLVGTRSCEQCQTYCRKGFAAIFDSGAYTRDHALRTKGKKNSRKKTSALERKKVPKKIKCVVPIDAAAVSNNPKKRHVLGPSSPPIDLNKGKEKGPQDGVECTNVVMEWLQGQGNHARYTSGEPGIKMVCAREISTLLLERGIEMTSKAVQSRITKAVDRQKRVGALPQNHHNPGDPGQRSTSEQASPQNGVKSPKSNAGDSEMNASSTSTEEKQSPVKRFITAPALSGKLVKLVASTVQIQATQPSCFDSLRTTQQQLDIGFKKIDESTTLAVIISDDGLLPKPASKSLLPPKVGDISFELKTENPSVEGPPPQKKVNKSWLFCVAKLGFFVLRSRGCGRFCCGHSLGFCRVAFLILGW